MDILSSIETKPMFWLIIFYLIAINIGAYLMFWADKRFATKKQWRISDKKFLTQAWLGGSLGCILGLRLARNKTRRYGFIGTLFGIFTCQIVLTIILLQPALREILFEQFQSILN